jgi:hypothetical protein
MPALSKAALVSPPPGPFCITRSKTHPAGRLGPIPFEVRADICATPAAALTGETILDVGMSEVICAAVGDYLVEWLRR